MKKALLVLIPLVLVGLIFAYAGANQKSAPTETNYIVIRYSPAISGVKNYLIVNYGGVTTENIEITKDQLKNSGVTNVAIDFLNKLEGEGYTLASTSSTDNMTTIFMKKK